MKILISTLALSVVILTSCGTSNIREPEYREISEIKLIEIGILQSTAGIDLVYYNPNNFGMQLKNSDLDIFIDGNLFGHSSFDTLIRIPRRDTFLLPVKFDVEMQNIFKNALSTLMGKEVIVKLTGKLRIGKANLFMTLPVNYESKQTFSIF